MLVFSCLFMWPYFCASVDGRLTDRRQRVEGGGGGVGSRGAGAVAGAEADRKRSRKSVCQFNVPFVFFLSICQQK